MAVAHARVVADIPWWERLADAAAAPPFDRPGWSTAWWTFFGGGELEVVAVGGEDEGALVPVARRAGGRRSLTNWHSVTSGAIATDPASAEALVAKLLEDRPATLTIEFVDASTPLAHAIGSVARAHGYRVHARTLERPPVVRIDGDWEAYQRSLSRNLRGDVGRRLRRLQEQGALELEVLDGSSRLDEALREGFAIEGSGWKSDARTAIASRPETLGFYTAVAQWAAERGWLRLVFLRLDGRALAFHLDLVADGVLYHLKGGFDPASEQFSPGKVLHHLLLEHSFHEGLRRYEFLGAAEPYKRRWANDEREVLRIQAFAPSVRGRSAWLAQTRVRPIARRVVDARRSLAGRRHGAA